MKIKFIISLIVIIFVVLGIFTYNKVSAIQEKNNAEFISLCNELSQYYDDSVSWNFVIYLDIDACLTCTDHVPSWIKLEQQLPQHRSKLLIYTNQQDSLDVAIAMELEGLETNVKVLDSIQIDLLNLSNKRTPIKILLDSNCKPILFVEPFQSENEAKQFYNKLLDKIRSLS